MTKYLFLLFAMTCIQTSGGRFPDIWRCENNEVVCYTRRYNESGIDCKFKVIGTSVSLTKEEV